MSFRSIISLLLATIAMLWLPAQEPGGLVGDLQRLIDGQEHSWPLVLDQQRMLLLRKICYRRQLDGFSDDFRVRALWTLVNCEYAGLAAAASDARRKSSAWTLRRAVDAFIDGCVATQFCNQEPWARNMLVAAGYREIAAGYLGEPLGREQARKAVFAELARIFAPVSSYEDANRSVLGGLREPVLQAQETAQAAICAHEQAVAALKSIYGQKPADSQHDVQLSPSERRAFYQPPTVDKVVKVIAGAAGSHPDEIPYAIRSYARLRQKLALATAEVPDPPRDLLEKFFGNDQRRSRLQQIREWFAARGLALAQSLDQLRNQLDHWNLQRIAQTASEARVVQALRDLKQQLDFSKNSPPVPIIGDSALRRLIATLAGLMGQPQWSEAWYQLLITNNHKGKQ